MTTQIGSDSFTAFRTGPSKSRLAFLRNLLGGAASSVVNEAALVYMRACNLSLALLDKLAGHSTRLFASHQDWTSHLNGLGFADLKITPDPVRVAEPRALCGAPFASKTCWARPSSCPTAPAGSASANTPCAGCTPKASSTSIPANDRQRNAIEIARRMIWWFHRALKEYKLAPSPGKAERLRAQFDRIFNRSRTGYATLDSLLRRLFRLKDDLLRVLDHPHIPLHTNASENNIRVFVTKRKISGGTVSDRGRDARDVMLGFAKTCRKLKIPFSDYLGARLAIPGPLIPHLATLVRTAPSWERRGTSARRRDELRGGIAGPAGDGRGCWRGGRTGACGRRGRVSIPRQSRGL